jgi:SecD/SecF fusion protein
MMQFMGETKFDFLKSRGIAFAGSALLIVAGLAALVARGQTNLDIDFTGGTLDTFEFVEPQTTGAVKAKLVEKLGSTISLERLVLVGEQTTAESGKRFRMRTTEKNQAAVTQSLSESFSDSSMALVRVTMEAGAVEAIPARRSQGRRNRQ